MTGVLAGLAPSVALAGVVVGVLAAVTTRDLRASLSAALDLVLAAALLRLAGSPTWISIASVAALVLLWRATWLWSGGMRHVEGAPREEASS